MTYFNLLQIAPPSPNDPLVNEVTQINNNWDDIDTKIGALTTTTGTITSPEQGQEYITNTGRTRVWNGAANRDPDDIDASWTAWTALPVAATVAVRPSFTPRWRNNTALRRVELAGGILKDAGAGAWPAAVVVVTTGVSGIPDTLQPIGGVTRQMSAAALPATGGTGAWWQVDTNTSFVRLRTRYMGPAGGGNFIQLDGIEWWY